MSTIAATKIVSGFEPIPGYVLQRQLGSGGFGEVWLAAAPGGLQKAVKLVYGSLDEKRAAREMKSLERIKGVNHPFLLTLERFEVVNGQLVIITELADGSLEDVYRQHVDRGSCGIPRKSLLVYMNDAADGLDYLNSQFRLQHLDVKPANLLMVGGHVKIADFGLVKDLREVDNSVVGGLTPIYAAPEVFDGRPSANSDQYSLAIMYQELLTGVRPFAGRTIAQLATQHVHSSPNLDPLPPMDRPVVARALEKNPERRFASCMEFVEALREASGRDVQVAGPRGGAKSSESDTSVTGTILHCEAVEDLSQVSADVPNQTQTAVSQALVVGLGGSGAEALSALRQLVDNDQVPEKLQLHTLLIDTDSATLDAEQRADAPQAVASSQTIHAFLRTPNDYRLSGNTRLASISRRWVYNVPRSGMTEGLRPLGRLALLDHSEAITQRLQAMITPFVEHPTSGQTPRVYVVSSLDGGTGGGMVWDVVNVLRSLLDQAGLVEAEIIPVLSVPSLQINQKHPLIAADTYTALSELFHYQQLNNGYPGDAGAGWSSVPAARSPLGNTYLIVRPGGSDGYRLVAEQISQYIMEDASELRIVLDAARKAPPNSEQLCMQTGPAVRSMGIRALPIDNDPVEQQLLVRSLLQQAVKLTLGKPGEGKQLADSLADALARHAEIDLTTMQANAWKPLAADEETRWNWIYDRACQIDPSTLQVKRSWGRAAETNKLEQVFAGIEFPQHDDEQTVAEDSQRLTENLYRSLSKCLNSGKVDLDAASEALRLMSETLTAAAERYQLSAPRREAEAVEVGDALIANSALHPFKEMLGSVKEPGPLMRYIDLRLQAVADARLARRLERLPAVVEALLAGIHLRRRLLESLAKGLSAGNPGRDIWKLREDWVPLKNDLLQATRRMLVQLGSLAKDWQTPFHVSVEEVDAPLREGIGRLVEEVLAERQTSASAGDLSPHQVDRLREAIAEIRPALLACGGRQRLVLVVGSDSQRQQLQSTLNAALENPISIVVVPGVEPVIVHEAQAIPLTQVLGRYQLALGSDPKVVGKLKSRSDIAWNSDTLA